MDGGREIGLFGGSFNPPHEGHRRAGMLALRRLRLEQLWWVVTPGNPLKDVASLPPLEARMCAAANVAAYRGIVVTGLEASLGTRYTADLIRYLRVRDSETRHVWIMGSDSLAGFHRWERWREIAELVPIAVVNRPGHLADVLSSPAAQALSRYRMDEHDAPILADCPPPAWVFLVGPRVSASSTALRASMR